jgi:oligopeptide/dipeptide ABC transporter ATP-binding protein
VQNLTIAAGRRHDSHVVENVSFSVAAGRCLGIVGESGSGKSMTMRGILGIAPAHVVGGSVSAGTMAMVFQDSMSALNPSMRVGDLVAEGLRAGGTPKKQARAQALELLSEVGIPDPRRRSLSWPHQLSGGLRQRVMIAMALSVQPQVLLCDEPTTALDVTIQDQVLSLLERLRTERHLALVFVSHDLAVISRIADDIAVMYSGSFLETGPTAEVIASPRHPYTRSLLEAAPDAGRAKGPLNAIPGRPPDVDARPAGCVFGPRCSLVEASCNEARPELVPISDVHTSACRRHELLAEVAI